ncbi:hypothetical protein SARC_04508 [Sphaeroforma arctica JP610]|uniref:Uncharacterized protein n=1 Tax=Sphaeroforma arctica JP610 TaxID=667725 RepID=A0A0L0G267_9EUKA|nr:hypothetical protein SARC_04508 [Sphaeroforma arctica JP610]KNC83227.1 hypothetical protein SARC_04508 [Sphaeroforma arctica JP610]|eukprot:XP_014157129.1 hypothetical protein SARC_04508 [Sphaeroforma arctica JP610]
MAVFEASWLKPFMDESEGNSTPVQGLKALYSEALLAAYYSTADTNSAFNSGDTASDDHENTLTPALPTRIPLTERQWETAMTRFRRKKIMDERGLTRIWSRIIVVEETDVTTPIGLEQPTRSPLTREQQITKASCLRRKTSMRLSGITRVWDVATRNQEKLALRDDLFWGGSDTLDQSPKNRRRRRKRIMIRRGLSRIWRLPEIVHSHVTAMQQDGMTVGEDETCLYHSRKDAIPDSDYAESQAAYLVAPYVPTMVLSVSDLTTSTRGQYLAVDA